MFIGAAATQSVSAACDLRQPPSDVHVYLINMDMSTARLIHMTKVFSELGLPHFERVQGASASHQLAIIASCIETCVNVIQQLESHCRCAC